MNEISKTLLFMACLILMGTVVIPNGSVAHAQENTGFSVDDFLPPVQGGGTEIEDADAVELVEEDEIFEEIPVVISSSLQDGFNAAADVHEESVEEAKIEIVKAAAEAPEGAGKPAVESIATAVASADLKDTFVIVSSAGGIGVCARACATYETGTTQLNQRLSRRSAFVRANAAARVKLAEALSGMSMTAKLRVTGKTSSITKSDGETDTTGGASENATEEEITQAVEAMLKGVAIDRVVDDSDLGMVTVSVFVTPKTLGRGNRRSAELQTAENLRDAMANIVAEVNSGVVPPVGGRVAASSKTGDMAWIGFGSSVVIPGKGKRMEAIAVMNAEKKAEMRAKAALLRMIRGESVYGESKLESSEKEIIEEIKKIEEVDPTTGKKKEDIEFLDKTRKLFESSSTLTEISENAAAGRLPAGVNIKTKRIKDASGKIVEISAMAVYLPALTEELKKANLVNLGNEIPEARSDSKPSDSGDSKKPVEEKESGKVGDDDDR